jgi:uncharacterized protein (TIRG00374 family)
MKWKLLLGALFSGIFLYVSLRGSNVSELQAGLRNADYSYFLPIFVLSIFGIYLRSYRWGIIIHPLEKIHQKVLFPITVVGLMAVVLLPMRAGEIVRPYLVSKRCEIRMGSAVGTIVVERVFDGLTLMLFLLLLTFFTELPGWAYQAGLYALIFFIIISVFLSMLIFKRDFSVKWIEFLLKKFPDRIVKYMMGKLSSFSDGLRVIPDIKRVILVLLISVFVWLTVGFCIYLLLQSFHFGLPVKAGYVVLVLTALGIMVPTGPGFVGNFHLFCIIGLALFGISKADALCFAILLHIIQVGFVCILGLAFIPFIKIPFSELIFARKLI